MGLETFGFINDLVITNPVGASDPKSQGDDHIRGIKATLKSTFPNASAAFYCPSTETKTGAYSVAAADQNKIILCDATSAAFTVALGAAATLGSRFRVTLIKIDSTANAITIDPNSSETIDGAATKSLSRQYEAVTLVCNGSAWYSEGLSPATTAGPGLVELATTTEVLTGTDTGRGVTPDALAAIWERASDITVAGGGTDLPIGEGGYVRVTGNGNTFATVTFTPQKNGRRVRIFALDAFTIVHDGSNVNIPGSANLTVAAGDQFDIISHSGTVSLLTNYVPNNAGSVRKATTTEVLTGTSALVPVTPDALAALWEKGSDITAAATITVGEGGYFVVTGNTGISDIDLGTDKTGRKVWLLFNDAPLLTHSSTLILPNGVNYQAASGDKILFVSEGSDAVRALDVVRVTGKAVTGPASTDISDSTATGRSILTAANAAAAATAAGVGTGNSPTFTAVTLSNGQIQFPATQVASSDANNLDDYEEGTFTPGVTLGGGATGVTYTTQVGKYTKIGRSVTWRLGVTLSNKGSSTGVLLFTSLPFTAAVTTPCSLRLTGLTSGVGDTMLYGLVLGTTVRLDKVALGSTTQFTDADIANTSDFAIAGQFDV